MDRNPRSTSSQKKARPSKTAVVAGGGPDVERDARAADASPSGAPRPRAGPLPSVPPRPWTEAVESSAKGRQAALVPASALKTPGDADRLPDAPRQSDGLFELVNPV